MLQFLQRMGKAIMLPIAALPIAGILLVIGGSLLSIAGLNNPPSAYQPLIALINIPAITIILTVMKSIGDIIFENLPVLFAVGVAMGLAKKDKGTAALSSLIGFIVMNQVISTLLGLGSTQLGVLTAINIKEHAQYATYVTTSLGIFTLNMSVFGGIITGIITSTLHNKYHEIELPQVVGFFSGQRFIPIITSLVMAAAGAILAFAWPVVQDGIWTLAIMVKDAGVIGTFFYGFIERVLMPFGLHHVFYTPFWFGSFVQSDVIIDGVKQTVSGASLGYFAQLSSMGDLVGAPLETMNNIVSGTTRFMAGKFPFMMFGLPAAALAMYRTASPKKKKVVGSLLISAAATSFLTGITEPLEFTFLFVSPILYGVHCILAGLSFMLMDILNVFVGMTFSGGVIDFTLFGLLPAGAGVSTRWYMIILVGIVYAVIYYLLFSFIIKRFNLKTPGREENEEETKLYTQEDYEEKRGSSDSKSIKELKENEIVEKAPLVLEALGGKNNIISVDACITRLRVEVGDKKQVNKDELKKLGAAGVMEVGNGIQVIFGVKADRYKNEINKILGSE